MAPVLVNRELHKAGTRSCMHIEIDITGSKIKYAFNGTLLCYIIVTCKCDLTWQTTSIKRHFLVLGPDYMSRAIPASWAASVCRDDFQPGIT